MYVIPERRKRCPSELQHDGATSVDHEVKPSVVPGHGESLVGQRGRDTDPNQAHARRGHNLTTDHSSATNQKQREREKKRREVSKLFGSVCGIKYLKVVYTVGELRCSS